MVDWRAVAKRTKKFVLDNFLPLSFLVAIVWALAWPAPGKAVISVTISDGSIHVIQEINIILVFFISGLVLKTDDLATAIKHKLGVTYGLISILFVTPCLGFALREIPLNPPEFAAGLALFSAVPTTLGVGVSLVRSCGGNEGLALLLTVASNIIGIFTMPLWIKALLGNSDLDSVSVDIPNLLARLIITIFVPSVVGKALRELPPLGKHVKRLTARHKTFLSCFSVVMLSMIVWQSLSGAQSTLLDQQFVQILYVILLAIAQHIIYLIFNFALLVYVFHMPLIELIATGIMSSQKSAPVAVTVISYLTTSISKQGLLIIPGIVGQISQIFIGSALAKYFGPRVKKLKAAQAAEKAALEAAAAEEGSDGGEGAQSGAELSALGSKSIKSLPDTDLGTGATTTSASEQGQAADAVQLAQPAATGKEAA